MTTMPAKIKEVYQQANCLYTRDQVEKALDKMAGEISKRLENTHPIVLCVMIGGVIPTASLLSRMDFPLELDYIHASRYVNKNGRNEGNTRAGQLSWIKKPSCRLTERTVLVIDDILDGGITLAAIINYCLEQKPNAVYSAVLADKQHVRETDGLQQADFTGLFVEDKYVFGYGLDYNEYLRNAPGIYAVADEHA